MPVTPDSTIGKLLEHPKAIEIFLKHGFTQVNDPVLRAMASGLSLKTAASFLNISQEKLGALIKDLNEAGVSD